MNTLHAKSTCCKAAVRRYGERRRQCGNCGNTWRIRRKKRGRKAKRASTRLVLAYLDHRASNVRELAKRRKEGKSSSQRALARSLAYLVRANPEPGRSLVSSRGRLILVADAIWYYVRGKKYTIYVLLIRPRLENEAVIWQPYLAPGHEDMAGWLAALATLPPGIQGRIGALVCDGGTGITNLAYRQGWLLQRCHFHLLAALQNYLTTGVRSRQRPFALEVMRLAQSIINDPHEAAARGALRTLNTIYQQTRSRGLRRTIRGLNLHWREYRTYITYPRWRLPATSNAAESCIQCIRDLLYRCRGFRSLGQLTRWLAAFTIHKKIIRCRWKNQPN